jgi:hypothetical protein
LASLDGNALDNRTSRRQPRTAVSNIAHSFPRKKFNEENEQYCQSFLSGGGTFCLTALFNMGAYFLPRQPLALPAHQSDSST